MMSNCRTLSNHSISYLLEKDPSWIYIYLLEHSHVNWNNVETPVL